MKIDEVRVLDGGAGVTLVEVAAEGVVGIGLTQSAFEYVSPIIERGPYPVGPGLIGADPREPARLWWQMFQAFGAAKGRGSESGLAVNAMAALDMAVWDLAGKVSGRPLHSLLGGVVRESIPAYASSSLFIASSFESDGMATRRLKSADELHAEAASHVRDGFGAVKFGWGNNFSAADVERLEAIRAGLGPDVKLMIDIGCPAYWSPGWNVTAARRAARILEAFDVYLIEEPMPPQDVEGHRRIRGSAAINIATGESLTLAEEFGRFIDAGAVDVVQPDAAQIGITQLVDVARHAEAAGVLCIPHSPWSAVAIGAHAQACLTFRNSSMVEFPALSSFEAGSDIGASTAFYLRDLVEHPPALVDGALLPSTRPGLGLGGFRPDALERLARSAVRAPGTWVGARGE